MSVELQKSVFDRWNDSGLNSSIATLYSGDDEAAPEGTDKPRAQYSFLDVGGEQRTRGHRIQIQPVRFRVWASSDLLAGQYLDAIDAAFVNSEEAATNPLNLPVSAGGVIGVDFAGRMQPFQETDKVWQGALTIEIRWEKANRIPA